MKDEENHTKNYCHQDMQTFINIGTKSRDDNECFYRKQRKLQDDIITSSKCSLAQSIPIYQL